MKENAWEATKIKLADPYVAIYKTFANEVADDW